MDVQKLLSAVACIFVISACGKKSADTVFSESGNLDSSACMGQAVKSKFIVQWEDGSFTVESAKDADEFKEKFIKPNLDNIRQVEYDRIIQLDRTPVVHTTDTTSDNWGQSIVQADALWQQGIYGQNVKVAVVDAYVDVTHPQIAGRIAINTGEVPNNGKDDDGNGYVDDYYGASFVSSSQGNSQTVSPHGTHVAGIIAADNAYGNVNGMAPKAQIIPAQFIANDGSGSLGDAVLALQYAAARGAKIINASWGGAPCVASLKNAFQQLESKGILIAVAAGNDGRDIDTNPEFPASFNLSNQITVAAASKTDFMTAWSNSGFNLVHVAAPGEGILSTVPGGTAYMDGTSMATPFVSGAAALLWSAKPNATAAQIKQALIQSVDVTPGHEYKVSSHGRINVQKALQALNSLVP